MYPMVGHNGTAMGHIGTTMKNGRTDSGVTAFGISLFGIKLLLSIVEDRSSTPLIGSSDDKEEGAGCDVTIAFGRPSSEGAGSADDILLLSLDSRAREGFIGILGNNLDESTLDHVITDATVKRIKSGKSVLEYQNQAKMLFRKLTAQSPTRLTIETGPYLFHYLIENDVCYLVLAERNYSKRLAYSYLEDLAQEFHSQYGKRVNSVTRPYSFIEFDTYIQKAKKIFTDSRARRNLSALNTELQDVQRIMVQNIDDVLQRGVVLSELDTKAQNLSMLSQVYKKDATHLNTKSMYVKAAAGCFVVLVFVLYFWVL
uniref:Uncharacterized protein n=1 Tax=Timema monikensis TaxID=170555 RepID=A0A7R9E6I1_9NEOP|nr:unnamed protein product [Timema monikensis]